MLFQPDEIKLMRSALDEAIIILPKIERSSERLPRRWSWPRVSSQRRRRVNATRISWELQHSWKKRMS